MLHAAASERASFIHDPHADGLPPDYAFGETKFGGNAQAITKQRWLHHTSFLWDFQDSRMDLLKHPTRAPDYRAVIVAWRPATFRVWMIDA